MESWRLLDDGRRPRASEPAEGDVGGEDLSGMSSTRKSSVGWIKRSPSPAGGRKSNVLWLVASVKESRSLRSGADGSFMGPRIGYQLSLSLHNQSATR